MAEEWEQLQNLADRSELKLRKEFLDMIQAVATAELERRILAAIRRARRSFPSAFFLSTSPNRCRQQRGRKKHWIFAFVLA